MIKIDLEKIRIETKEDLKELITKVNYVPSLFDQKHGHQSLVPEGNRGDALEWDLMDILIEDHFDTYLGLRRKDPNLQERFEKIVDFFNKKNKEFNKNYEAIDKMETK